MSGPGQADDGLEPDTGALSGALRRFGAELDGGGDVLDRARALAKVKAGLLGDEVGPGAEPPTPRDRDDRPRVGRYLLLDKLGAGGMGVVYLAFDPQLERKVALKLVRSRGRDADERAREQQRLLREGRTQARLDHPNVVAVHDVEFIDDQVVLVMDHVQGRRLDLWLARPDIDASQEGERRRVVLEMFLQAGRGLAAAHAAGLVHRDFKPANVLVDLDGRARVLDFGLALPVAEPTSASDDTLRTQESLPGAGTPRYMAPEQRRGEPATPASDQYGFCLAVWEALFGELPEAGRRRPRPRALVKVLERGLAENPEDRWPSMAALLQQLERLLRQDKLGSGHGRSRELVGLAIGAVNVGVLVLLLGPWEPLERGESMASMKSAHSVEPSAEPEPSTPDHPAPPRNANYHRLLSDASARARALAPSANLVTIGAFGIDSHGRVDLNDSLARWHFGFWDPQRDEGLVVMYLGDPNHPFPVVERPARNVRSGSRIRDPQGVNLEAIIDAGLDVGCPTLRGRRGDSLVVRHMDDEDIAWIVSDDGPSWSMRLSTGELDTGHCGDPGAKAH